MTLVTGLLLSQGAFAMQKDSRRQTFDQMMIHCGMGGLLGSLLALAMLLTDQNIFQSIVSSPSPLMEMAMFIGLFSFVIGIGATMSGFIFSIIELNASEAKQRTKRTDQWRGHDKRK